MTIAAPADEPDQNPSPNAASPAQVAAAAKADQRRQREDGDDIRFLLEHPQGRRFLGNLIYDPVRFIGGGCGVTQAVFSQSHPTMAAREGARDVGLRLLACCESVDFDLTMRIRQERQHAAHAALVQRAQAAAKAEPDEFAPVPYTGPVE